jgi:hypothetical protein
MHNFPAIISGFSLKKYISYMTLGCHTNVFITDCTRLMTMALECPPVDYYSYQVLQKSIIMWFKIRNGIRARADTSLRSQETLYFREEKQAEKKKRKVERQTDRQSEAAC